MSATAVGPGRRAARTHVRLALAALALALLAAVAAPARAAAPGVLWGAYIKGTTYGYADAPFDTRTLDAFEAHAGRRPAIVHWGQPWYWASRGGYQPFQADMAERVRLRGSIPMITWTTTDQDRGGSLDQPDFRLATITGGRHDAYVRAWARAAKAWGHPLLVRFDHEMNGSWFVWSERVNGNAPGDFVRMWRHVVDIFRQEGATNVTWVWAPNRTWAAAPLTLEQVFPGQPYVDWVGLSAYNWGTNPAKPKNAWQGFEAVFRESYDALGALAPDRPIIVAETASTEYGGSKAAWITDALATQLPVRYPRIRAFLWFNWNVAATFGDMDWVIESSASAQAAFASGIASSYYAPAAFASLPLLAPVRPLAGDMLRNTSFEAAGLSPWFAPWSAKDVLGGTVAQDAGQAAEGRASMRVGVAVARPTTPWDVQVRQAGLALVAGRTYTLTFAARASVPRPASVILQGTVSPWPTYVRRDPALSTAWTRYAYSFAAPVSDPAAMLAFNLAGTSGTVWIDDVSLTVA